MSDELEQVEVRRLLEQERLDAERSPAERNRLGQFATPPRLAHQIVRFAKRIYDEQRRPYPLRFLEPAFGSGAFCTALFRVFESGLVAHAVGVEFDGQVAGVARALWKPFGVEVVEGDFTNVTPDSAFDLIISNPPYVRHHHLTSLQKRALQDKTHLATGYRLNGLTGLYCYFVMLAERFLAPGGIAIWLIPSEFMDVNYGESLRRFLVERVTLLQVHRFRPGDVQFEDALVSSVVVAYQKRIPADKQQVVFSLGGSLEAPDRRTDVPVSVLKGSQKWSHFSSDSAKPVAARSTLRFGDVFAIKRGLVTGANEFFVLSRERASSLGLPPEFLKPILPSPRYLRDTIIEAEPGGFPRLERQDVLLDCPLRPDEIKTQYPHLWAYIQQGEKDGIHARYLTSRRTPWYRQEQREPAPFLCSYMGRFQNGRQPFRVFWNRSRAVAPNVYLLIYPIGDLAARLRSEPALYETVFAHLQALDVASLTREGRVYGGALHKIEPGELARVPFSALEELIQPLRQLTFL